MAYAQIVCQYAKYLLMKLDFHSHRQEWICDKEGNLDWAFFEERNGARVEFDYAIAVARDMLSLLGNAAQLMDFVRQGVTMDNRTFKEGVNTCVCHPLVNLVVDAETLYNTSVKLIQKAYDCYNDLSNAQLDQLDDTVDMLDRIHEGLKPLFATCAATKYVAQLVSVPTLDEVPKFRKPAFDDSKARAEEERRRREAELLRQQQEDAARRAMMDKLRADEEARLRAEAEARRLAAEQLAEMNRRQMQLQQDSVNQALAKWLTDAIGKGRRETDALGAQVRKKRKL